jgi:hypothetical protein
VIATTRDTRLDSQILQSMNVQDWFVRTLSHKGQGMDEPRVDEMLFAVQSFDCVSQQARRAVCIAGICMRLYACEHSSGEVQLRPGSIVRCVLQRTDLAPTGSHREVSQMRRKATS